MRLALAGAIAAAVTAARATGDTATSDALLGKAAQQDAAHGTYYGAAWVELGRALLAGALRCGA